MARAKMQHLKARLEFLNFITGSPDKPYERVNGRLVGQAGCYVISGGGYGGYKLCRITNEGGGQKDITKAGTKTELYELMGAFIEGVQAEKAREHKRWADSLTDEA